MSLSLLKEAKVRAAAGRELQRLQARAPTLRAEHEKQKKLLASRIVEIWGSALDLYQHALLESQQLARRIVRASKSASPNIRRTHLGLFGRTLLTASEVLDLLRSGHGHGAYARWRTLFELAAFAEFIKAKGADAANRYVDHYAIGTLRYLTTRWPSLGTQGCTAPPETTRLFQRLTAERARLEQVYGKPFSKELGWASKWIPDRVTIQSIVAAVDLPRVKPEYQLASNYVHAGGRGSLDNVQFTGTGEKLRCWPSDELISRPGRLASVSLALHCSMLVQACQVPAAAKTAFAIGTIAQEAEKAFVAGHERWVEETRRDDLDWQR